MLPASVISQSTGRIISRDGDGGGGGVEFEWGVYACWHLRPSSGREHTVV